jgi:hypothetical protein
MKNNFKKSYEKTREFLSRIFLRDNLDKIDSSVNSISQELSKREWNRFYVKGQIKNVVGVFSEWGKYVDRELVDSYKQEMSSFFSELELLEDKCTYNRRGRPYSRNTKYKPSIIDKIFDCLESPESLIVVKSREHVNGMYFNNRSLLSENYEEY